MAVIIHEETDNALTCCGYPISILIVWTVHSPPPTAGRWHCSGTGNIHIFGFREPTNAHYFKDFQSFKNIQCR